MVKIVNESNMANRTIFTVLFSLVGVGFPLVSDFSSSLMSALSIFRKELERLLHLKIVRSESDILRAINTTEFLG